MSLRNMKWPIIALCTASMTCTSFDAARLRVHRCTKPSARCSHQLGLWSQKESNREDERQTKTELDHPHSVMWSTTIQRSPDSHVHPSIKLAIRPPSEGGTGIVAIDDIPTDTEVMFFLLDEVGTIEVAPILDSYKQQPKQNDALFNMLVEMWDKTKDKTNSMILTGILAHLQLTRYKDMNSSEVKDGFALDESRRLGHFLDAMPMMPKHSTDDDCQHPFPTHFLFWTDEEVDILLQGTIAQSRARRTKASLDKTIQEWLNVYLDEHRPTVSEIDVLDAFRSAYACILSRGFGDTNGNKMLVPIVDMTNHDDENPNVVWGSRDEKEGRRSMYVKTLRGICKGEELFVSYAWYPSWAMASSYGFVPKLTKERFDCSVIPLFPGASVLGPDGEALVDFQLEANHEPWVGAISAAVNNALAAGSMPKVYCISQPSPPQSGPRSQPVIVVETKIDVEADPNNQQYHTHAIEYILPAFRAAACALSQLRGNHQNDISYPIKGKKLEMAAASSDDTDWDVPAVSMIRDGINEHMSTLIQGGKEAETWLKNTINDSPKERELRANLSRDVRNIELRVLEKLMSEILEWEIELGEDFDIVEDTAT